MFDLIFFFLRYVSCKFIFVVDIISPDGEIVDIIDCSIHSSILRIFYFPKLMKY